MVSTDALGEVALIAPADEPDLFVIALSDSDGITDALKADAEALVARGAAVALVDVPAVLGRQTGGDGQTCRYLFGALEALARVAERDLGVGTWRWPVLFGRGEGGALAYLALAQAPTNTAAGAVSLGFSPTLPTSLPLCPGATVKTADGGTFTYLPQPKLPGRWTLVLPAEPDPDTASFVSASGGAVRVEGGGEAALRAAAVDAALTIGGGPTDPLSDLPLVELPAQSPKAFAIILSGDGGWRDLDKQIGEYMAAHNVSVVGLDSLRFFWRRKTPEEVAAAIDRIVAHYRSAWHLSNIAVVGYSLGADALPLAWPALSASTQSDVSLIALLGLAPEAELEVTVSGWLGLSSSDAVDLRPALAALPLARVVCVYGKKEAAAGQTACTAPELDGATRVEREGGHHFDGNYEAIADILLARIFETTETVAQPG